MKFDRKSAAELCELAENIDRIFVSNPSPAAIMAVYLRAAIARIEELEEKVRELEAREKLQ